MSTLRNRETFTIAILSLSMGLVTFEMLSANYLVPVISSDFKLNNTDIGVMFSAYWVAFAAASCVAGSLADKFGNRVKTISVILLAFSFFSVLAGFTDSFHMLVITRIIMGLIEGALLPLIQSLAALSSSDLRRGINMGIVQSLGSSILGWCLAPLIVFQIASIYGWRAGFFFSIIPGMCCAFLVARLVREAEPSGELASMGKVPQAGAFSALRVILDLGDVLKVSNVWICSIAASFVMAFITIGGAFIPLYLAQVRHLPSSEVGLVMSMLGVCAVTMGLVIPAVSDRLGRKLMVVLPCVLGPLCAIGVRYDLGSTLVIGGMLFVGWSTAAASTLLFATIPAESVPPPLLSRAIGFSAGASTLFGGVAGPMIAGWSADRWGLQAALIIHALCALLAAGFAVFLRETGSAGQVLQRL